MEITFFSTDTSEIHLHVEKLLQNTYWTLAEHLRLPKRQENPNVPGYGKRKRKKERQNNKHGTGTSGRELWRRKSFHTLGRPFTGRDEGWAGGKLRSHGGECSNKGAEGKPERFPHRGLVLTALTSLRGLSTNPPGMVRAGSWGSGFGVQIPGRGLGLAGWTQHEGG